MIYDEDQEALAAEYVLGTLDAEERAQAQALIRIDSGFAEVVHRWERRLGELHPMVGAIEPPLDIWDKITARLAPAGEPAAQTSSPPAVPAGAPAGESAPTAAAAATGTAATAELPTPSGAASAGSPASSNNVVALTRRSRRWRGAAIATGASAASLAALVVALEVAPDQLPSPLRPRVQTAGLPAGTGPAGAGRFVAVLQRDADSPAFLLTVDVDKRTMSVRRVTAERRSGKSYELWLVSSRFTQPRSLGLVGAEEFTTGRTLASYDPNTISDATYAVSLEPEGGSPTGSPTGPVLWSGKLLETAPPAR